MNDELKMYRGEDFVVSKHIKIHQPSLSEICDYGEQDYYSMIYQLTSTPQSMKVQLWDMGIDYTTITPYQLFYSVIYRLFPKEKISIIFGDLDLANFQVMKRTDNGDIVLSQQIETFETTENKITDISFYRKIVNKLFKKNTQPEYQTLKNVDEVIIDEYTYNVIVDYLRQIHIIEKDEKIPANESTKLVLIEDAREEYERNKDKPYSSQLKNLISSMVNSDGFKYNHHEVWNMKINAFMDSVRRVSKIKMADLLLQSGYSGYGINLKDVNKKQLDWLGELE